MLGGASDLPENVEKYTIRLVFRFRELFPILRSLTLHRLHPLQSKWPSAPFFNEGSDMSHGMNVAILDIKTIERINAGRALPCGWNMYGSRFSDE
jgi:hypothetical protein